MDIQVMYPLFASEALAATGRFYEALGFEVAFAGDWHLHVVRPENPAIRLGFLRPGDPARPAGLPAPRGAEGAALAFEVADADAVHADLALFGFPVALPPHDEPCGRRRFTIVDPNGIVIDVSSRPRRAAEDRAGRAEAA